MLTLIQLKKMNKAINEIRLFLFTCSGEDNYILKRCTAQIQTRFALIGFFVLLIFIGCFFSATFFIISLFDGAKWVSLPMGIIWGAVIVNIYLLLLHTISPVIIPLSAKRKKNSERNLDLNQTKNRFFTLSMNLRISFMILLAVIIAQPLNVFIFSSSIKNSIEKHKISERIKLYTLTNKQLIKEEVVNQKEFNDKVINRLNLEESRLVITHLNIINSKIKTDKLFVINASKKLIEFNKINEKFSLNNQEDERKTKILNELGNLLNNELTSDKNFIAITNSIATEGSLKADFEKFRNNLITLVNNKIDNYNSLNVLLNKSNFYIKTIQLLFAENPLTWLLTLIVCSIFLLPIYFKYKARSVCSKVFKTKEKNEPDIIKLREELIKTSNFNWLESKIKTINIRNVRTSDYYFQRMLIEHRIILEEYDDTKKLFKKNLTNNIQLFNKRSLEKLNPLLEKLKQYNIQKYNEISKSVFKEYVDEEMNKYEYWLDSPFRTKMRLITKNSNDEKGLIDFIYDQPPETKN